MSLIRFVNLPDLAFKEVILQLIIYYLNSFLRTLTSFVIQPLTHILTFKSAFKQTAFNVALYVLISSPAYKSISVNSLLLMIRS
jgi:hypothetical protein